MIDRLTEILKEKVPINLGSLMNSFDSILESQEYYEEGILENNYLCSFIEGIIDKKFINITYMPCENEYQDGDNIDNSDEVIIVFMRIELHDKKYYRAYYDLEDY